MRVRIKISINSAESIGRMLMTIANNIDSLLIKQQLHMDFMKLHNHLATKDRKNGNKLTSFTLDGLTIAMLGSQWAEKCLMWFDEPNQYMIRYALKEVLQSAEKSLMKTRMQI